MARKDDGIISDFLELVALLPWWIGVGIAGAFLFVGLVVLPSTHPTDMNSKLLVTVGRMVLPILALATLGVVGISALKSAAKRRLLDRQGGIDSIRSLSWKEFEELLGEFYRRKGYHVVENDGRGADGGVDLRIEKSGASYLVQCKHWKAFKVPVGVVREMFGLMVAEKATGAIVVTSGVFTQEARDFAEGKPVELIEGRQLAEMIRSAQMTPHTSGARPPVAAKENGAGTRAARCPMCGKELVLREARRGRYAGKKFWGCKGYPACRYIRNQDGR